MDNNFQKISFGVFLSSSDFGSKFKKRVINTVKIFNDRGYEVNLGKLAFKSNGYTSGSVQERANEFNELMQTNDILIWMIGGYNSSSILEYIDYDLFKKRKIKVIGHSDTSQYY